MNAINTVVCYSDPGSPINLNISISSYKNFLESNEVLFTLSNSFNLDVANNFDIC
jgi:hypothetical protein